MADTSEKQRRFLRRYLETLAVHPPRSFEYSAGPDFAKLVRAILEVPPWAGILTSSDVAMITKDVVHPLRDAVPETYAGPLAGVPEAPALIDRIQRELVKFYESIPRKYFACFELPSFPRYGQPVIELSAEVALLDTGAGFPEELLETVQRGLRTSPPETKLRRDTVYVRFSVPGYADGSSDSYSDIWASAKLKHFAFLGAYFDKALKERDLHDIVGGRMPKPPRSNGLLYNPDNLAKEAFYIHVPDELWDYIRFLRLDETKLKISDPSKGATIFDLRTAVTPEEKRSAIAAALPYTLWFASLADDFKDAERIRAGIEWCMDSQTSGNQTMAFLQACIGLEAVLGDNDKGRVTEKLADRFSYLLGETESERVKLRAKFLEMYDSRSGIVHGRRPRLGSDDLYSMVRAVRMLKECVAVEVAGLARAHKK